MTKTHDPIKQLSFLSQTLSNDKKPISLFISAGCPLGVPMPDDQWPLIPAIKELTQKVNLELVKNEFEDLNYATLLTEIENDGKDPENIELILSFVRSLKEVSLGAPVRGFDNALLIRIETEICKTIAKLINVELPSKLSPYHQMASWIGSIDREIPIEIFTTNYDLLTEQALEETSVPYYDGFVGAKNSFFDLRALEENSVPKHWTRIWKIHGSLNWYQDNGSVHRSTGNKIQDQESHLIYPSHLKYEQSRKMPYLALIDHLTDTIKKEPIIVLTTGYSFNDEHLNDTIVNALKVNPTSMVIALLFGKLEDYPNAINISLSRPNLSLWAFDEAIIGTRRGNWMPNDSFEAEENIANVLKRIETPNPDDEDDILVSWNLKLGDFAQLGNFFQALVGRENMEE